jgi:hypothetical protein
VHLAAAVRRAVKITGCASFPRDASVRLQPVRQDNIRVHGAHIQVENQGALLQQRLLGKAFESFREVCPHIFIVRNFLQMQILFTLDCELKELVQVFLQLPNSRCVNSEWDGKVYTVDT